jgi:hypothetical protein
MDHRADTEDSVGMAGHHIEGSEDRDQAMDHMNMDKRSAVDHIDWYQAVDHMNKHQAVDHMDMLAEGRRAGHPEDTQHRRAGTVRLEADQTSWTV